MNLKNLIFAGARHTHLLSATAASEWRRQRLLILCYHGVSAHDEHQWNPLLYITPELLKQRVAFLRRGGYSILPLNEALERLRAGTLPSRSVAITFDDGSRDFAEQALPILTDYEVPVTVYLTTYYCEHRYPVFNTALSYILWRGRASGIDLQDELGTTAPVPLGAEKERKRAVELVQSIARARHLDGRGKNQLLAFVARRLKIDFEGFTRSGLFQLMTPGQVRNLPHHLVDVQLHTHRHRTPRERAAFERELDDNHRSICAITGIQTPRLHFCYPSGDYDASFLPWLQEWGVVSGVTCVPGLAGRHSHPLLLPRLIDTMSMSQHGFEAWVSGLAALVPRRAEHRLNRHRIAPS